MPWSWARSWRQCYNAIWRDERPVEVVVSTFEDWTLPRQPFDAVVVVTAWHWLDSTIRARKAAAALRPGGTLATITTFHVLGGKDPSSRTCRIVISGGIRLLLPRNSYRLPTCAGRHVLRVLVLMSLSVRSGEVAVFGTFATDPHPASGGRRG